MIKANLHKYFESVMCKVLKISRSTYYYESTQKMNELELVITLIEIFKASLNNYGTRKIKRELSNENMIISHRHGQIEKQDGLVSNYTIAQFRPQKDTYNEFKVAHIVKRKFNKHPYLPQ